MNLVAALPHLPTDPTMVIVDPGKRTGVLLREPDKDWVVTDVCMDDLPVLLTGLIGVHQPAFVGCEDFSLTGRRGHNDPSVPSAVGKGVCLAVCMLTETPLIMLPRGVKSAGHKDLDERGRIAFSTARNDHRRDVVDLAGYCLRELRVYAHNAAQR